MSYDINRSRSSTRSAGCNEDCNVFIKNIPIELEKEGLQNLFVKAGAVEKIKIIPPKDENHSYTFGFVEFKHKTAAATAIEMFDNYKIGGKYLTVKLASNNNNTNSSSRYESSQKKPLSDYNSDGYSRSNSRARSETAPVLQSPQNEIDDGWSDIKVMKPTRVNLVDNENDDPFQRGTRVDANKRMMGGRGILLKQQYKKEPPRNQIRDNFDLSRPFARDLCLRKSQASLTDIEPLPETVPSKESSKESSKEYNKGQHVVLDSKRKAEEFVIGKRYHVILTHGTTPSNFFVQQLSILPDSFDPSNTDYYKKELLENKNNEYSCRPQRSSIRCKLNNLIPAFNAKKWSSDACEIFESLIGDNTIDEVLIANVISCEDFEPQKGRIEKIYGIDLFFGNESTIEYMIRENIAVQEIKENNEESDDKFVQLSQASSEQPLVQQKPKIVESIVTPIIEKQITHLEIKKINHVKLEKNRQYKFLLMFFDENFIEQSFSLSLQEQASKEQELSNKLQEAYSNDFISKPTSLADLKVDMRLEALYDVDERWYRVRVTEIKNNSVKIHFLDYGNTVILSSAEVSSKLRFREYYKNVEEERIFGLEYQAIKCVYSTDNKKDVSDFFEKLSVIEETDSLLNGFELSVKEIIAEDMDNLVYRVVFPSEDVDQDTTSNVPAVKTEPSEAMHQTEATLDNEVSNILEDATALNQYSIFNMPETAGKSIDLDANKEYNVSISHIVGINEFYVQLPDNLRELMEHQERINNLAEAIRSPQTSPNNVGDYIIARYVYDSAWYKGIITKVNKTTDDYLYEVFFVDYGNTEVDMTGHDILSVQYIIESLTQQDKKKLIIEMANVIEFSFQAICCQLKDKKDSIRNTESLKTYMSDCLTFTIKSQCKSASQFIGDIVKINKDTVSLYTDGKLLDENFEPVAVETLVNEVQSQETKIPEKVEDKVKDKVEVKRQEDAQDEEKFEEKVNILEVGSVHKYKLAFFASETEIYFNLAAEYDCLAQMQDEINKSKNSISGFQNMNEVKIGDVVLAKFYEEDHSSFSWYRVRIVDLSDKDMVTVFYLDYGNSDESLQLTDLAHLPRQFSFEYHPQYSYKVQINGIKLDLESPKYVDVLTEYFTGEEYQLKVINHSENIYHVELWNHDMSACFNSKIDPEYELKMTPPKVQEITRSRLDEMVANIENNELLVKTKSMFIENFQKPFYFCLDTDLEDRNNLAKEMNEFYENEQPDLKELNGYGAAFSEESWYRVEIKALPDNQVLLYYIDFGYEEVYSKETSQVKELAEQFYAYPRYVFGASLLDQKAGNVDVQKVIEFDKSEELNHYDATFEEFFKVGLDEHRLRVFSKLKNTDNDIYVSGETYYGVQMFNENNACLNEMIAIFNEEQSQPKRPPLIALKVSDLPKRQINKQMLDTDRFMLFARHIDLFYIFEEKLVKEIQNRVQIICQELIEQQAKFTVTPEQDEGAFNKGDLVFGKYEDDDKWYRCLITNCNKAKGKFEIFFIDLGNTEVVTKKDLLYGWSDQHISVFKEYEQQAVKCKLYGLLPPNKTEFTEAENLAFKVHISNKLFKVKLIDYNQSDDIYEVTLNDAKNKDMSVQKYLTENKLALYRSFRAILDTVDSKEGFEFYAGLLKKLENNQNKFE